MAAWTIKFTKHIVCRTRICHVGIVWLQQVLLVMVMFELRSQASKIFQATAWNIDSHRCLKWLWRRHVNKKQFFLTTWAVWPLVLTPQTAWGRARLRRLCESREIPLGVGIGKSAKLKKIREMGWNGVKRKRVRNSPLMCQDSRLPGATIFGSPDCPPAGFLWLAKL